MNENDLLAKAIDKKDPLKTFKQFQLKYWWHEFHFLFCRDTKEQKRLKFFSEILSHDECWEKAQGIPHIKLNRRMVAKKMVRYRNRIGNINPLSDTERYQVACRCCLEEDMITLFMKKIGTKKVNTEDRFALKKLANSLYRNAACQKLVKYWSYILIGQKSELELEGKHLYEHGIYSALDNCGHVEAVEFFWNKIKSLPEDELSFERKHDIFVYTTVRAAWYSDILFEFCISQVSPNMYLEILKKDMQNNRIHGFVTALIGTWRFDLIKTLFDCLVPNDIPNNIYANLLKSLTWDQLPKHYTREIVKLFVHVYMKEGFVRHRAYVLEVEKIENPENIVVHLIGQNYMEIAFEILDSMPPSKIKEFVKSPQADYILYLLERRRETDSLNKWVSYTDVTRNFDLQRQLNLNTSPSEAVIKTSSKK